MLTITLTFVSSLLPARRTSSLMIFPTIVWPHVQLYRELLESLRLVVVWAPALEEPTLIIPLEDVRLLAIPLPDCIEILQAKLVWLLAPLSPFYMPILWPWPAKIDAPTIILLMILHANAYRVAHRRLPTMEICSQEDVFKNARGNFINLWIILSEDASQTAHHESILQLI